MAPAQESRDQQLNLTTCVFIGKSAGNCDAGTREALSSPQPTARIMTSLSASSQPSPGAIRIGAAAKSTRAFSRRNRVFVLRDFLLRTYPSLGLATPLPVVASDGPKSQFPKQYSVLDVAGGRGDLSWILRNADGIDSIIADPRIPDHRRLIKSVKFLLDHPEEAALRSVEGLPTHQPLAALLPQLMENKKMNDFDSSCNEGFAGDTHLEGLTPPKNIRIHVDETLVLVLQKVLTLRNAHESQDFLTVWNEYWVEECQAVKSNTAVYGGTPPKVESCETNNILDSQLVLKALLSTQLIIGFHPDQATEAAIDLALLLQVPFSVVPCCVFPGQFPNRSMNGKRVRSYNEFLEYLCMKHPKIRKEKLQFMETDTAKKVVLYMLEEDFLS